MSKAKETKDKGFSFFAAAREQFTVGYRVPRYELPDGTVPEFTAVVEIPAESEELDRLVEGFYQAGTGLTGEERKAAVMTARLDLLAYVLRSVEGFPELEGKTPAEIVAFFRGEGWPDVAPEVKREAEARVRLHVRSITNLALGLLTVEPSFRR